MEKICHYTTANNALKILSSNALKFGQIKNSNDPFENLVKRYNLTYRIQDPLKSFMNEIFEFVNTEVSIVCFGVNDNLVLADQNWTMWAHYGETHSGVCLTFDLEAFLNEVQKQSYQLLSGRINYTNSLIIPPDYFDERMDNSLKDILIEFQKPLLFSKHRGWSYENEYRIMKIRKLL